MFARLLVCVGLLALPCFGLVGCEDEDPQIVKEVAELVETVPASGERAAAHQPVVLYFDKAPLAVTVNGAGLLNADGENLDWEAAWGNRIVTFRLGAHGELLENGKSYIVRMVAAEAWTYNETFCECIDCSLYGNIDRTIEFMTVVD